MLAAPFIGAPAWGQAAHIVSTIVSGDDPAHHIVAPTPGLEGLAQLNLSQGGVTSNYCSGSLLSGGRFILTSAHCLTGESTSLSFDRVDVLFADAASTVAHVSSTAQMYLDPLWTGHLAAGNDLALLRLDQPVTGVTGLELSSQTSVLGAVVSLLGIGDFGTGTQGAVQATDGSLRQVSNRYEILGSDRRLRNLGYALANNILWDYDDGTAAYDTFGRYLGIKDTGLGVGLEGSIGPGDSGGPSLLDGKIVGVHSFVLDLEGYVKNPTVVGSFGEIGADVLVSPASGWIGAVTSVPEPGTPQLMMIGALGCLVMAGRRRLLEPRT